MASQAGLSSVIKTSLVAGITGAGLALLLAPRSGRQTREVIRQKSANIGHDTIHLINGLRPNTAAQHNSWNEPNLDDQTILRMQRDAKRQLPILTNWEREV